jgi:hypothetical protein
MQFAPNEDQAAFLSVLEQMMGSETAGWKVSPELLRYDWSAELDRSLDEGGFYECAAEKTLGLVAAAAMTYRLASLPVLVECAASSMLRPLVAPLLPRPLAVTGHDFSRPIPYLPVARSLIVLGVDGVKAANLSDDAVETIESLYAYPMGVLRTQELEWQHLDADPATVLNVWRAALAAELAGVLKGGIDSVVAHVRDRQQFGRPLGAFQAIQHRLAGAAVKIEAAYWLALKAAQSMNPVDAATALGYAQEASTRIGYDLHQFMGAMGLTLEHPLHRWTYRARLLRSSLGGANENLKSLAAERWRTA